MRSDIANGIWLCQTHAKLIDDDELNYTLAGLRDSKDTAEHMAALEAPRLRVSQSHTISRVGEKGPQLLAEMREDLTKQPLVRQFILLSKRVTYNPGPTPFFVYFYEDHDYPRS